MNVLGPWYYNETLKYHSRRQFTHEEIYSTVTIVLNYRGTSGYMLLIHGAYYGTFPYLSEAQKTADSSLEKLQYQLIDNEDKWNQTMLLL